MMNKQAIHAVLRASPEPLTLPGIIALMHRQTGSRDTLHLFTQMHGEEVEVLLEQLVAEGQVVTVTEPVAQYHVAGAAS